MDISKIIEHENENWSKVFQKELQNSDSNKLYSSYWWENYYDQITSFTLEYLQQNDFIKILEAGSGSGKSSILLGNNYERSMLDISDYALKFSKLLSDKFDQKAIDYIQGDIFDMPFEEAKFDFVWNIGVLEHYEPLQISKILKEMKRVTKSNGSIAFGVPTFYSLPTLKAWVLKYLPFIPGYRLDTEKFYSEKQMIELIKSALIEYNVEVEIRTFGNPLFMETPEIVLKSLGKLINKIAPNWGFLKIYFVKFK